MCCLFGLIDYRHGLSVKQKNKMLSVLAAACESRGTDATGIAYNFGGKLRVYQRPIPGHRMRFRVPADVWAIMGHTRMTTQGSAKRNYNNHPFPGRTGNVAFALAHNGVLYNDRSLRRALALPEVKIETDSYIGVQLIERNKLSQLSLCVLLRCRVNHLDDTTLVTLDLLGYITQVQERVEHLHDQLKLVGYERVVIDKVIL